eukprot:192499-Rhodomonas_salina.1
MTPVLVGGEQEKQRTAYGGDRQLLKPRVCRAADMNDGWRSCVASSIAGKLTSRLLLLNSLSTLGCALDRKAVPAVAKQLLFPRLHAISRDVRAGTRDVRADLRDQGRM